MLECKSGTALSVWRQVPSLNKKFVGKNFVGDTSLSEKFSWMEANHENNEIKSTTKIFTYTVFKHDLSRQETTEELVSRGLTLLSCRGVIACSVSLK